MRSTSLTMMIDEFALAKDSKPPRTRNSYHQGNILLPAVRTLTRLECSSRYSLHDITDTTKFKKSLKTILFGRAFPAA